MDTSALRCELDQWKVNHPYSPRGPLPGIAHAGYLQVLKAIPLAAITRSWRIAQPQYQSIQHRRV
ncbi:MAG: hypothetical protein H6561_21190 [Lewinellaceae bacterium]|nr:hypothetical protein [Lewinellaceae bacterium]